MKTLVLLPPLLLLALLCGCQSTQMSSSLPSADLLPPEKEPIATSLFPSDQAILSDEAVQRILASKLELPAKARLALMKFPGGEGSRYYGRYYWHDEEYLKLQQAQVDTLAGALLASEHVADVTPLPSLMTPTKVSIPVLREAAVRLQADLLLVFRVTSDTYSQYRVFAKDKVKAYSTCELVLLDVRTGLVPFARVVSREKLELKQSSDLDLAETIRRAEQLSTADALNISGEELVRFVKSAPKKSG